MIIWTWWNIYYICSNIPTLTRKNTFMSTYQVDSFFSWHNLWHNAGRRVELAHLQARAARGAEHLPILGPRCRCPIFRCLTSFEDWTHFWWTNSELKYGMHIWWNIYLKHHIGFGTSFLHSVCGIAFRITLSISWLPKLSFSKGWLLWIQHKSPRGLLAVFFSKWHTDTYCIPLLLCQSKVSRLWNTTSSPHN